MATDRNLLDVLMELQSLDRVPRLGYSLRGVSEPESVSEHVFHLVFLVWSLAAREPDLDRTRAVELAIVHDLAEVRFGDLPRTAAHYLPKGTKASAERAALADLLSPLGEESLDLFDEYQAGDSREARFVKICDRLQMIIKASVYRQWGSGDMDDFLSALDTLKADDFTSVDELISELKSRC